MPKTPTTAFHVWASYEIRLGGRRIGDGVVDEVWELGPGATRCGLYSAVMDRLRTTLGLTSTHVIQTWSWHVAPDQLT